MLQTFLAELKRRKVLRVVGAYAVVAWGVLQVIDKLFPALLRVRSSDRPPDDAYVAVKYRDGWFWIDDRDHDSKSAFSFLMLLFSLTETGTTQTAPIVTVPAR